MTILAFKKFEAEAEVCGQTRTVVWDGESFFVRGVRSFVEVSELMAKLRHGEVSGWPASAFVGPGQAPVAQAQAQATGQATPPRQPVAPSPALQAPEAPAPAQTPAPQTPPVIARSTPSQAPTPQAPPAAALDPNDTAVFGRLTRLGEVVDEIVRRGQGPDYASVLAKVNQLKDSLLCPVLEKLEQTEGGPQGFEDRLRRQCRAKNIPGALE